MGFLRDVFYPSSSKWHSSENIFCAICSILRQPELINKNTYRKPGCKFSSSKVGYPLRVLFFGTDNFAVENLKILNHELKLGYILNRLDVVTSNKHKNCAVSKYSHLNGLNTLDWPLQRCPNEYDIGLVASFGHLIPERIINSFPHGMLNVHASLLPRWRGAAPIVHAIMNGDKETGVTIMRIKPKRFDIGDILAQSQITIGPHETNSEISNKLAIAGGRLLVSCLRDLHRYSNNAKPQSEVGITYAPKVTPSLGMVQWQEKNAESLYNLWRALFGVYHLTTSWHGTQVRLMDVHYCDDKDISGLDRPGKITFSKSSGMILVICADGGKIGFRKLGVTGKKPMSAMDFYNGYMSKRSADEWYFS
ncbi:methionyl-tRNA formyltransferase, mitochondrial [Hetaerina americana]|uniref:methionyl-tRNA formyltransferase, mitochondrial n=1 Tax=Hetaerina americana TaxID=62018 RepID=UPI003A7F2E5C